MGQRPDLTGQFQRIEPGRGRIADHRPQGLDQGFETAVADRLVGGGQRTMRAHEHGSIGAWLVLREGKIGQPHGAESGNRVGMAGERALLAGCEILEAAKRHLGQQGILVAEMAIGRGGTHACPARGIDQREALRTALAQQLASGLDQSISKVAMMVAFPRGQIGC